MRSGRWIEGAEEEYRKHNRYGYATRIERRRTSAGRTRAARPSRGRDLREFINRLRASRDGGDGDDETARDIETLKRAVHKRIREREEIGLEQEENHPSYRGEISEVHLSKADGIIDDLQRLTISDMRKVSEELKRLGVREVSEDHLPEPRRQELSTRGKRHRSPGAREMFRNKFARFNDGEAENHRARSQEELVVDEERRALWNQEEKRRKALMEEEEKWRAERRKEDDDCRKLREKEDEDRRKRQAEEDADRKKKQEAEHEERKRWFRMEMEEFREGMQESLNEAGNTLREYVDRQVAKSRKGVSFK